MNLLDRLSILIVTWNGDKVLSNCLNSLKSVYDEIPEIIVVDNANLNSTKQIVMGYPNCKYVSAESNLGFAGGNNLGLTYCSRDFVLLLNNDTIFHTDSLSPLLNYLKANIQIAVVQGTMKLVRIGNKLDTCGTMLTQWGKLFLRHYMEPIESTKLAPCPVFSAKGAFLLFRKSILADLGNVLFYDFFDRDVYREYQLFEPAVLHDLFDVRGNLVFIARIGMDDIPKRCALLW